MKRGASSSSGNSQNQTIPEGPFADLLPELISVIASFLPAYSFIEEQSVQLINKKWLVQLQNQRPSLGTLMASCQNSYDSLNILKNEKLIEKIPYKELLVIANKHAQIGKSILPMLSSSELCFVGKQDIKIAKHILATRALAQKMNASDTYDLLGFHLELAIEFFSQLDTTQSSLLTSEYLRLLGQQPTIALNILLNPDLYIKLSENDLGRICIKNIEIALFVLNNETLDAKALRGIILNVLTYLAQGGEPGLILEVVNRLFEEDIRHDLTPSMLGLFAVKYPELAMRIIKDRTLSDKLSDQALVDIGSVNLAFTQYLCKENHLLAKLSDLNLSALAKVYLFFAQHVFANQNLLTALSPLHVESIACSHLAIAQHILENKALFNLSEMQFFSIQFAHPSLRATMYSTGTYLSTLPRLEMTHQDQEMYLKPQMQALVADETATNEDFDLLILQHSLAIQSFPSSIRFHEITKNNKTLPAILALLTSALKDKLFPDDLKELCLFSEKAGMIILNDPTLYQKLNFYQLKDIAQHNLTYAKLILGNQEMCDDFSIEALTRLCERWADIEKLLAQDPILRSRIPINFKLRTFIQKQAQYYANDDLISDRVKKRSRKKD